MRRHTAAPGGDRRSGGRSSAVSGLPPLTAAPDCHICGLRGGAALWRAIPAPPACLRCGAPFRALSAAAQPFSAPEGVHAWSVLPLQSRTPPELCWMRCSSRGRRRTEPARIVGRRRAGGDAAPTPRRAALTGRWLALVVWRSKRHPAARALYLKTHARPVRAPSSPALFLRVRACRAARAASGSIWKSRWRRAVCEDAASAPLARGALPS